MTAPAHGITYYVGSSLDIGTAMGLMRGFIRPHGNCDDMRLVCIDPLISEGCGYWMHKDLKVSIRGKYVEFHQCRVEDYKRADVPANILIRGYTPPTDFYREGDVVFAACDTATPVVPDGVTLRHVCLDNLVTHCQCGGSAEIV